MKVYFVSAVHNDIEHTKKLIDSISAQKSIKAETILVDDGSTDGTGTIIKEMFSWVKVLKGDGNLWWTGGINKAIEEALKTTKKGDFILTINNDCVLSPNFVEVLVRASNDNDRAIIGSLEYDINTKKIVNGSIVANWEKGVFQKKFPKSWHNMFLETDTLQTKGTIIPIEVFEKIGLLDQRHFPHYGSDFEFFIRAKNNGFKLLVSTKAKVYCDQKRTGINSESTSRNIMDIIRLAFSRKSQINIADHVNLIRFTCPNKYKLRNYYLIFKKILFIISEIYPIPMIKKYLR